MKRTPKATKSKPSEKTKITKTAKVTITKPVASKAHKVAGLKSDTGPAGAIAPKAPKATRAAPKAAHKPAEEVSKKARIFMLLDVDNCDIGRYTGHAPRQAALKAANAGVHDIRLRETGVRRKIIKKGVAVTQIKIHAFEGSRGQRPKKDTDPDWMPDVVNFPIVEKLGTEWIEWSN